MHPTGFRLGVVKTWDSKWFASKDYAKLVEEDFLIRNYIKKRLFHAGIARVEVERAANKAKIRIFRPAWDCIRQEGRRNRGFETGPGSQVQAGNPH